MRMMRRAPVVLLLAIVACAINPVTGERELMLISERQEIGMGQEYSAQVEQQIGLVDDAELQAYVEEVGMRMARASERPDLPWRFRVLDDPTPNAFAVPGGFIYVTRGLMDLMGSEAQLASVLGHEIGHVTARHSVSRMSQAQLAQLGMGLGMILLPEDLQGLGQVAGAGLSILFLKYSRDDERQSDELGFGYALEAGYDVREMAEVFASLDRASEMAGASALPSWLSSHPNPPDRIESARARVAALDRPLAGLRVARATYLRQIDGLVYGPNPRNGFFQDGTFIHPDLEFRMDFPSGWATQNLARVVAAMSPERDAAVQLTLAEGTPSTAARAFLAQDGITEVQSRRVTINGFGAVVVGFQAAGDTPLRGTATFLADGSRTYQLLGYTPAARFGQHASTFSAWAGSYQRLTDPELLGAQPDRIAIVELPTGMTLAGFTARYPSVVPLEVLALLNQVEGESASLAAGSLAKRVVNP